jgi:PKHD-type hydroxylase
MINDYFTFSQNLEENYINNIETQLNSLEFISSQINNQEYLPNKRSSKIKWIPYNTEFNYLYKDLYSLVNNANNSFFKFSLNFNPIEDIQYSKYTSTPQDHFDWHIDTHPNFPPDYLRKLSLTIQLSDPNEYEGGDLEISLQGPEKTIILKPPKEKGKIIIFPSYMWHRVTPVTKGIRKSLVWWVGGAPFR